MDEKKDFNREETFKEWSKKLTETPKELEELFQEERQKCKASQPETPDEGLDEWAFETISGFMKKQLMSTAAKWEGLIFGGSLTEDQHRFSRMKQQREVDSQGKEESLRLGLINKEGQLLFTDYDWRKGETIPKENKEQQRRVCGIARPEGETGEYKPFHMYLQHNLDKPVPSMQAGMFRGNKGDYSTPFIQLNSATVTEFKTVESKPLNFKEIGGKYFPLNSVEIETLFREDGTVFNPVAEKNSPIKGLIVTRGIVADISYGQEFVTVQLSGLSSASQLDVSNVTCYVAKDAHIEKKFDKGTIVYVIGNAYWTKRDRKMKKMSVFGIWADPSRTIKPQTAKPIPGSSESEGDEWNEDESKEEQ